jgi:hypothetical protein
VESWKESAPMELDTQTQTTTNSLQPQVLRRTVVMGAVLSCSHGVDHPHPLSGHLCDGCCSLDLEFRKRLHTHE